MIGKFLNYDNFINSLIKLDELLEDLKNNKNSYGDVTIEVKAICGFGLIHNDTLMKIIPDKNQDLTINDGLEDFCLEDEIFIMEEIINAGVENGLSVDWLNNNYISLSFKIDNLDDVVNFEDSNLNSDFKFGHIKLYISNLDYIFESNLQIIDSKLLILENSEEKLSIYDKNVFTLTTILSIFNECDIENISISKISSKINEFYKVKQFLLENKNKIFN